MAMTHEITTGLRHKRTQRKGRGESSGRGKTSGRGNKGSKARTGTTFKRGHEHGQTPIFRRFPKRGFSNDNFERRFHVVNLQDLAGFDANATVDAAALEQAGLIPDTKLPVKILGEGQDDFSKKLNVVAAKFSKAAHAKITAAGGTAKTPKGDDFQFPKEKKKFVPRPKAKKGEEAPAADTK
jgi:large subunit ribosomal protein L15